MENIGAAMAYLAHNLGLNPSTDPANMGLPAEEALPILAGTIGVATGGMGIAVEGALASIIAGSLSIGLGTSGMLTSPKGESGLQRLMPTQKAKINAGYIENGTSIGLGIYGIGSFFRNPQQIYNAIGGATGTTSGYNYFINQRKK